MERYKEQEDPTPSSQQSFKAAGGWWVPVVSPAGEKGEPGVEPPRRPLGRSFSVGDRVQ